MIDYRIDIDRQFAFFYAEKLGDVLTLQILNRGKVTSASEATHLSHFFWKMVDAAILDEKEEVNLPWDEGAQHISERVMLAFSGHLESCGHGDEWEAVSDAQ